MFGFNRYDNRNYNRNKNLPVCKPYASYKMDGLRHNPYVGSFHSRTFVAPPFVNTPSPDNETGFSAASSIMSDAKTNPMVGFVRHSPPINQEQEKSLKGEKSVGPASGGSASKRMTQLQLKCNDNKATLIRKNISFVATLKQMRKGKFSSASSAGSQSIQSENNPKAYISSPRSDVPKSGRVSTDDQLPLCSICIEPYADGDEILTLACSHCFHSECVSKWFYQSCLNGAGDLSNAFRCPECRQDHVALSEAGSVQSSEAGMTPQGIESSSFLTMGQSLLREGGYDFVNDLGSERSFGNAMLSPKWSIASFRMVRNSPGRVAKNGNKPPLPLPCIVAPPNNGNRGKTEKEKATEEAAPDQHNDEEIVAEDVILIAQPNLATEDAFDWSAFSDCGFPLDRNG